MMTLFSKFNGLVLKVLMDDFSFFVQTYDECVTHLTMILEIYEENDVGIMSGQVFAGGF